MSENIPPPASSDASANAPGRAAYDKGVEELRELLHQQAKNRDILAKIQEAIHNQETNYLDNTPHGNALVGYDNYTKGVGAAAGSSRRRGTVLDTHRVFSRSDVSFNPDADAIIPSTSSTPIHTAPTPVATSSFLKGESASNIGTPNSATSANKSGAGTKKNKKTGGGGEDSDTDTRDSKKARTGAAPPRK